jgi:cell fate regulator YaaT (PSP1 superfamily)
MNEQDYLVRFGRAGDFLWFRPKGDADCRRGDRVVVETPRGLEIGQVLRAAPQSKSEQRPVHALLRRVSREDEERADYSKQQAGRLAEKGASLAQGLALPLCLMDAEIMLDGQAGVLYCARWEEADLHLWVSTLAAEFDLALSVTDLAPLAAPKKESGCGAEGCGAGTCGTCGSGGGCGSCGSPSPAELQEYFAGLRAKMDRRTSLL